MTDVTLEKRKVLLDLNNLSVWHTHPQFDNTVKHIKETLQRVTNVKLPYSESTFATLESKLIIENGDVIDFTVASNGLCVLDYLIDTHSDGFSVVEPIAFTYECILGGSISQTISIHCVRKISAILKCDLNVSIERCYYVDIVIPEIGLCEGTSADIYDASYKFISRSLTIDEFKSGSFT